MKLCDFFFKKNCLSKCDLDKSKPRKIVISNLLKMFECFEYIFAILKLQ